MTTKSKKVLMARVDRIGDLILTLPMEEAWKQVAPQDEVFWLVEKATLFLFKSHSRPENVFTIEKFTDRKIQIKRLQEFLKKNNFDVVIGVHTPWWVSYLFWRAKIPLRVGVASQWFSWLFYNKPIRQRRSQALKSEALYNLELVAETLKASSLKLNPSHLKASQEGLQSWKEKLKGNFVVIHPGMAGSARNWILKNYKLLAQRLFDQGVNVVVTGSKGDLEIVKLSGILEVNGTVNLVGKTSPEDLLAVLSLAQGVVAPSTGVAHMAAALGVKTVGLYSPVKVQAPLRWAPLGPKVRVLVPEVSCPGDLGCLGSKCPLYDCMEKVTVDSVVQTLFEGGV